MEISSPGHDELRACLSFMSRSVVEDHSRYLAQARRCDCTFVLAVPVQTSAVKLQSVAVVP